MCHASDVVVISHGPDHIAGLISYKTLHWEALAQICLIGKHTIWPICSWMLAAPWPSFNKSICSSAVMLRHLPPWPHGTVASQGQICICGEFACPDVSCTMDSLSHYRFNCHFHLIVCTCALWARGQLHVKSEPERVFCCGGMTKATLRNRI